MSDQATRQHKDEGRMLGWLRSNDIRNEKGDPIEFLQHQFLIDIYLDDSQYLTVMKAAQVGMSTCAILKNHHDAKNNKLDIIYTLPTDQDVSVFVGGKVNRIISNNLSMIKDVADKDSIDQKQVGNSMIYFRGTWTKKSAIMVTADRLVHDEKDSSKLDIIADYQSRLQHSKFRQVHTLSHPSLPETGVHADWLKSDQKHWFIKCNHCGEWQYLSWSTEDPADMSVDIERRIFACKKCHGKIFDTTRRKGQWVKRYLDRPISGYWVPLLIAPWVSAGDIVDRWKNPDTTQEFFYTKILGLPYADSSSKLLRESFFQNLTGQLWAPQEDERVVIGVDTGLRIDYVIGNDSGLFMQGDCEDYGVLDAYMKRWRRAIAVVDQGGDLIGARKFYERWPGRVFLCLLAGDRKGKELIKWGKGDEFGSVSADRNRMVSLVVGEFRDKRIPVHGTESDWYEYWLDWNNLSKIKILDPDTNQTKGYKWVRSGRDHRALATIFWRVGMRRFAGIGSLINPPRAMKRPQSYMINPDKTVSFNPTEMFGSPKQKQELQFDKDGNPVVDKPPKQDAEIKEAIEESLDRIDPEGRWK